MKEHRQTARRETGCGVGDGVCAWRLGESILPGCQIGSCALSVCRCMRVLGHGSIFIGAAACYCVAAQRTR